MLGYHWCQRRLANIFAKHGRKNIFQENAAAKFPFVQSRIKSQSGYTCDKIISDTSTQVVEGLKYFLVFWLINKSHKPVL